MKVETLLMAYVYMYGRLNKSKGFLNMLHFKSIDRSSLQLHVFVFETLM